MAQWVPQGIKVVLEEKATEVNLEKMEKMAHLDFQEEQDPLVVLG